MKKLIVSDTIRWSRDIYVEFISGKRQYRDPVATNQPLMSPQPAPAQDILPPDMEAITN